MQNREKKIGLVTVHNANNYGAIFQTYALQEKLSEIGDTKIVNYNNKHISRSFDLVRFRLSWHGFLGMGKDIFRLLPRRRVIKKFKAFIRTNLKLSELYSKEDLKSGKAGHYDVYVAGSDQIWNPACISEDAVIDDIYFLNFVANDTLKISYGSSLGAYEFNSSEKLLITELLSDFSNVSVREKNGQAFLNSILNKNVGNVVDPTLLLSEKEWLEVFDLDRAKVVRDKYILLYTVPKVPFIKKVVEYYKKILGLKVISIEQGLSAGAKVDKQIRDAGPKEFIQLFSEAEFVITDSFHGTCFSLTFKKPFVSVSPGANVNRVHSLLSQIGLSDRIIFDESQLNALDVNVNFTNPCSKLAVLKKSSLNFLKNAIQ